MPPKRTLLDYMSGGQYQTSGDIPPMIQGPRMSQAEMLTALHSLDEILNPPLPPNVQAPGLGLLEWADTGPIVGMKALAGLVGKGGKKLSKLQKTAKEGVEEMVTLYRGYDKWYPGNMVKEGKFLSPGGGGGIYVTNNKEWVSEAGYLNPHFPSMPRVSKGSGNPSILEFEVPKSWFDKANKTEKYGTVNLPKGTGTKEMIQAQVGEFYIEGGIPVKFLKKRHK